MGWRPSKFIVSHSSFCYLKDEDGGPAQRVYCKIIFLLFKTCEIQSFEFSNLYLVPPEQTSFDSIPKNYPVPYVILV